MKKKVEGGLIETKSENPLLSSAHAKKNRNVFYFVHQQYNNLFIF